MTPNNPYNPDENERGEAVPRDETVEPRDQRDPLAGNPYSTQQRQAPPPDLDSNAPNLASNDLRRMNRRALGFLAGIVVVLLLAAFLLLRSGNSGTEPVKKAREETVSVPVAPIAPPPVPAEAPTPAAEPIALAPPPPLPTPEQLKPNRYNEGQRGPSLLERRMMADGAVQVVGANGQPVAGGQAGPGSYGGYGGFPGMPGQPGPAAPPRSATGNLAYTAGPLPDVSSAEPLTHPDTLMLRGTFIRCTLETRIITDIPGFTSCVVTEPIYSFTGKRLLLPKGSKVLGKYEMEPNGSRVAVIWDRIVTPTGIDVNMASPGIDTLGGAGHPGYYNAHWGSRIGSALLISLLSDAFKYEAAEKGPRQTSISNGVVTQSPFESNTATTMQQLANNAVQRAASRPATVTINQGTILAIYVAKDVDFSGVVARY